VNKPIRVLQVVGAMNRGGVETWLLNVLRRLSRNDIAIDLMVHTDQRAAYDDEVEALGATIHRNSHTRELPRYGLRLHRILSGPRRYDVVHSHVHHYSGVVLAAAMLAGVPVRVAHSHSDTRVADRHRSPWRRAYLRLTKQLIRRVATDGFACSDDAGRALFGERWAEDGRWRRLYCGIDTALYTGHGDREGVRAELALPTTASVMIHVGRFDASKNQSFLIDVLAATRHRHQNSFLVMIGSGPMEPCVAARAEALGMRDYVRFCGPRADVHRLLRAADAFVFPSLHEGLPLTCLEAQAAGLPIVLTDAITREVIVDAERVSRLPLGDAEAWARAVVRFFTMLPKSESQAAALSGGPFDIEVGARTLLESYRHAVARRGTHRGNRGASSTHVSASMSTHVGD
jgi:glycosyltransferase involved in cell wall biosynthesis